MLCNYETLITLKLKLIKDENFIILLPLYLIFETENVIHSLTFH